jgi:two-component system cell cycle sensor histidine kinase/response regulator CckA
MKTILVVDDDAAILALIHSIAGQDGYAVLQAATAQEAFERFEDADAAVDLVIADVELKFGSGIDAALELQALVPFLKILIMSGYPSGMWSRRAAAELERVPSESVAIMPKPFRPAQLLDAIHRLIGLPAPQPAPKAMRAGW